MVSIIAVNTFIEFVYNRYDFALKINFKSFKNSIIVINLLLTCYIQITRS